MMKRVLVRADANNDTGMGHLMRSTALAQRLCREGREVLFVTATQEVRLREYLKKQSFRTVFLDLSGPQLGGGADWNQMGRWLDPQPEWVILDNHYFDVDYQSRVRDKGMHLLLVDDRGQREFEADLVVNSSAQAESLRYRPSPGRQYLLGPRYAMIREELTRFARPRKKNSSHLLVTLGGSSQKAVRDKILEGVSKIQGKSFKVKALRGITEVSADEQPVESETFFEMAPVYHWADFALCAGGGTCWELCFFGVTGIVGALAEHQHHFGSGLARLGLFKYVGWYQDLTSEQIEGALRELLENPQEIDRMRARALALVDGKGTERIVEAMKAYRGQVQRVS